MKCQRVLWWQHLNPGCSNHHLEQNLFFLPNKKEYYLSFVHEKKSHMPQTHYSTYYKQSGIYFVANKLKRAIDLYNYNFDRA